MTECLHVEDLSFALTRSPRRSTVGITVDRDGSLLVSAPDGCPLADVDRAVRRKLPWLYRKLAEKAELLSPPPRPKEFVPGEGFSYLGRSYRLSLVADPAGSSPPLRLHQGRFLLLRDERSRAADHFANCYTAHAHPWLERRVALFSDRVEVTPLGIRVRDLGYRWGSCTNSGLLHFHWRCILLPPRILDYLVVHELVHLHELNHGPTFWRRLERTLPDYADRRRWLAENGVRF
jgi:predicted metal-dependent hydrolase